MCKMMYNIETWFSFKVDGLHRLAVVVSVAKPQNDIHPNYLDDVLDLPHRIRLPP
jgi:hypothetical protein